MLQYSQCTIDVKKDGVDELRRYIARHLHIREERIHDLRIVRKSLDARRKPELYYHYTVVFSCQNEQEVFHKNKKNKNLSVYVPEPSLADNIKMAAGQPDERIVVVGSGPAGLLCAYFLAKCGRKPLIIERGASMWERMEKVSGFWKNGVLDPDTNVSFGEGGAGTFSDGKLNTGVRDRTGKKKFILDTFIEHGAPEEIGYLAKPHIGTDELREVILSMRQTIQSFGGSYRFHTKWIGFETTDKVPEESGKKRMTAVVVQNEQGETERIPCDKCVLAIGHSARDTFEELKQEGIAMEAKPFAVGVRVVHPQTKINEIQYGRNEDMLPPADYKLTGRTSDGRGVYSFCMCPGGYVVNASSEEGRTVVNGMSDHARNSGYANSAIVVTVNERDYGSDDVLAGMEFQRRLEQKTFEEGRGKIPVQRFSDFTKGVVSQETGEDSRLAKGKIVPANVKKILPTDISNGIMEGMKQFGRKMKGFDDADTLLLGTETRTSSPVRILRDGNLESQSLSGVYPCGEGAGYAGGIMSAAMDGLRAAARIVEERE